MATSAARKPPRVPASPHLRVANGDDRRHIVELKSVDFESMDESSPESSIHPLKPPPLPRRQAQVAVTPPNPLENAGDTSETLVDFTSPEIWVDVEEMTAEQTGRETRILPNPSAGSSTDAIPSRPTRSIGFGSALVLTLMLNAVLSVGISAITVKVMLPAHQTPTTQVSESESMALAVTPPKARATPPGAVTETIVTSKPVNIRPPSPQGQLTAKTKPLTNTAKATVSKVTRSTHR